MVTLLRRIGLAILIGAFVVGTFPAAAIGQATITRFRVATPLAGTTTLPECLPAHLVGRQTGREVSEGKVVEVPSGGASVHGTTTLRYRVRFEGGLSVVGTATEHFSFNFASSGTVTTKVAIHETRWILDASGERVAKVMIHALSHLTFHDGNANGDPDDGEMASALDRFFFRCA